MAKKQTPEDFFARHNSSFIRFGRHFVDKISDPALVDQLAEKDPEKLAKVFKLVFEMMDEYSRDNASQRIDELIDAVRGGEEE